MTDELKKEAEEYALKKWEGQIPWGIIQEAFQDGAKYGYNKKCEETFEMALSQIKHDRAVVFEENERLRKANEWHYPSKGELPEYDVYVFLWCEDDIFPVVASRHIPYGKNEKDWVWDCKWGSGYTLPSECEKIIAWQYLPEPPKEAESC